MPVERTPTSAGIIGREAEIEALDRFVADDAAEPTALLMDGEAGIGKSTLFEHAIQAARRLRHTILVARPARSETDLSYVALVELLDGVDPQIIDGLPPPQTRVLNLLLRKEEGRFDRLSLSVAMLATVRTMATDDPLLVAVDDVQWIDPSSEKVLAYVVRRLAGSGVRLLLVRRTEGSTDDDSGGWPFDLARALPADRLHHLRIGPVGPTELARMMRRRLGWAPSWPRVLRIAELTGGNPFYALEIARSRGSVRHADALDEPLPAGVTDLVRARLAALPAAVRTTVQAASVLHTPTKDFVRRLVPAATDVERALVEAERAGVVVIDGDRVRFAHPILSAASSASIPESRRPELHRAAAELADDPEERAHHLAAAARSPDAHVAAALEEAAERAWWRGAPDAAADLLREATRLTPPDDAGARTLRRIALGRLLHMAGDAPGGIAELESIVAEEAAGPLRARARYHLMYVARMSGAVERSIEHGVLAAVEAEADPLLQAEIYELLSRLSDNDIAFKLDTARKGLEALARVPDPDPEVAFYARAALVEAEFAAGLGIHLDALEPTPAEPRRRFPPVRSAVMADDLVGRMLIYDARIDEGLHVLRRFHDRVSVENRSVLPAVLGWIIEGEIMGGRVEAAVAHGEEARERSAETGADHPWAEGFHAVALAMAGRLDDAEAIGERIVRMAATDPAIASDQWPALLALGVTAMGRERLDEAARHLGTLTELKRRADIRDPRLCAHAGELIEALIGAGLLDDADEALVRLQADAERATATSSLAIAFRGQALLAAARGQVNEALDHARRSVERFDALPMPFERARSSLLLGQIHRRRKEKRLARQALTEALETFEMLGAPVWAERARAELARIPVRQAPTRLTPTEERIAALAAAGLTNREIAERSFVSPKTVEANLARAYRKLGIRTRAELGRVMADRAGAVET